MNADTNPGAKQLAFEELLTRSACAASDHTSAQSACSKEGGELVKQFEKTLPFELTTSQRQVSAEIEADLMTSAPMLRRCRGRWIWQDAGGTKCLKVISPVAFRLR